MPVFLVEHGLQHGLPLPCRGKVPSAPQLRSHHCLFGGHTQVCVGALSLTSPQQQGPLRWVVGVLCGGAVSGPGDELVDQQPVVAVPVGEALAARLLPRHGV